MKRIRPILLPAVLIILCIHGIWLSRKVDALSTRAEIETLRVQRIDLVSSSGKTVGGLYAGDTSGPSLQLRHRDTERGMSHSWTMDFVDGAGPRLDMMAEFVIGEGPEAQLTMGYLGRTYGLRIEGSGQTAFPPLDIGWGTEAAGFNSNRYYHVIPEGAFEPTPRHVPSKAAAEGDL